MNTCPTTVPVAPLYKCLVTVRTPDETHHYDGLFSSTFAAQADAETRFPDATKIRISVCRGRK